MQQLKEEIKNAELFNSEILRYIEEKNLWNIWVPEKFGGLEKSFSDGLRVLQNLAQIDGSLGWTITLCSGANYFVGNLEPSAAAKIFKPGKKICLGGSGKIGGVAEKKGNNYLVSGNWSYATGSYYLTHFTFNARIMENNVLMKNKDGSEMIRSFIIPKHEVEIIDNWNAMGLKATVTNSFKIDRKLVSGDMAFAYDKFYLHQPIFKIPFSIFADLSLWVNYVGMATHFIEESKKSQNIAVVSNLQKTILDQERIISKIAAEVENEINDGIIISKKQVKKIHLTALESVHTISEQIILTFPRLGMKASTTGEPLNQIFLDYFTATQHRNFTQ